MLSDYSFVDRDMVMRYHWGLAVGHKYTYDAFTADAAEIPLADDVGEEDMNEDAVYTDTSLATTDLTYEEEWEAERVPFDEEEHEESEEGAYNDEELLEFQEMYGDHRESEFYE
jgi:hypothetical protein